jgi:hypothetical protein
VGGRHLNGDTDGIDLFAQSRRDIGGQPLLYRESTRLPADVPREFGEADHAVAGDVGHVCYPVVREGVVLTVAVHRDAGLDDDARVPARKRLHPWLGGLAAPLGERLERRGDATLPRHLEAITLRVRGHRFEQEADTLAGLLRVDTARIVPVLRDVGVLVLLHGQVPGASFQRSTCNRGVYR